MPKQAKRKQSKPKIGLGLVLELGDSIQLTTQRLAGKKATKLKTVILDNWIANFQEALDVPHESFLLKDFCATNFFKHKTGLDAETVYRKTQDGDFEGAELFVEYGAHVGALIADLEILLQPTCITIKGPIAKTFDAWNHAMGKARKNHLGKKPPCKITLFHESR